MSAARDRFIQLALRPLQGQRQGREQAEEDAAAELAVRLAHAQEDPASLDEAVTELEKHSPPPAWRMPAITGGVMLLLAVMLGFLIPEHWEEAKLLGRIHQQGGGGGQEHLDHVLASMGPAGKQVPLSSFYHHEKEKFQQQVETLLEQHPGDKAVYRYYAMWYRYFHDHAGAPPDFMEKWNELDPGNAIWGINLANSTADHSTYRSSPFPMTVSDEAGFERALATMKEAARRDHCTAHYARIEELQLASFVPESTLKSYHLKQDLIEITGSRHQAWTYSISWAVALQAERLATAGDKESLKALLQDYRKILLLAARDRTSSAENVLANLGSSRPDLKAACIAAGLTAEVEWIDRLRLLDAAHRTSYVSAVPLERLAGALHKNSLSPAIAPADLKPGRLAEYSVADRFMAASGVILGFLLLAGASLEILRRGMGPRGVARGLSPLFRRSDWLWLFGIGLVAPLAWWMVVVRFTPLGGRDIALYHYELGSYPMLQPWLSQGLGGIVLLIASLYQTARWRWSRRGALLSFSARGMWIGWTMVMLAALFIPAMGGIRYLPKDPHKFILCGSAAGAIPLLWLLWRACMGLFTAKENSLQGLLTLRAMMPGLMAMALLMLVSLPLLRMEERGWVEGDVLLKPAGDGSGLTIAERRSYDLLRPGLIEALEGGGGKR